MRAFLLLLVCGLGVAASPAVAKCPRSATTANYDKPGPYGVGQTTITFVDTHRGTPAHGSVAATDTRTLVTEIWYPTDSASGAIVRDAPVAHGHGPFPLVMDSHGLLDQRTLRAYYAVNLASRGFVVAAPDFPVTGAAAGAGNQDLSDTHNQPGDVSFLIDRLLEANKRKGHLLYKSIAKDRIGASGLSLGGLTTVLVTFHPTLRDPRIKAALALAPASCIVGATQYTTARPDFMVVQGDQDLLVPIETNGQRSFDRAGSTRRLVTFKHGSHTAFSGAVTFPATESYDATLGCPAVQALTTLGNIIDGMGSGIDPVGCGLACDGPTPTNAPMLAARQHDLTSAIVAAFFESTLKSSRAARCFVDQKFDAENADVTVQFAPKRR